ncbi:hypothetical protein ACJEIK_28230 [Mycobacterium sp. SMC-16]|uniref:hypothetical protein n=1 Tax=Mycobacterium sp. SMC-16 TaxID=3385967 RepID=UPI00390C6638
MSGDGYGIDLGEITQRAIETAAEKSPGLTIDQLLLAGGSTRMPIVHDALRAAGFDPISGDFDLAKAKGAAIYGQMLLDTSQPPFSLDDRAKVCGHTVIPTADTSPRFLLGGPAKSELEPVLSRAIGVQLMRDDGAGKVTECIRFLAHANDPLPLTATKLEAAGALRDQTGVRVRLYQQGGETESEKISDNLLLADLEISGLSPLPSGSPIELGLSISAEGEMTLTVREPKSGRDIVLLAKVPVLTSGGSVVGEKFIGRQLTPG